MIPRRPPDRRHRDRSRSPRSLGASLVRCDPWADTSAVIPMMSTQSAARRVFPELVPRGRPRARDDRPAHPRPRGPHRPRRGRPPPRVPRRLAARLGRQRGARRPVELAAHGDHAARRRGRQRARPVRPASCPWTSTAAPSRARPPRRDQRRRRPLRRARRSRSTPRGSSSPSSSELLRQAPEAWVARRLLPLEPAGVARFRWDEHRRRSRRRRPVARHRRMAPATCSPARLSTSASTARSRPASARCSRAPPRDEHGPYTRRLEITDMTGHVHEVLSGGPCPARQAYLVVDRGEGLLGCVDAEALAPWPSTTPTAASSSRSWSRTPTDGSSRSSSRPRTPAACAASAAAG
jgi:hypothetical protein